MSEITIPEDIVTATQLSAEELLLEIAIYLYQRERLTLEQASKLAQLSRLDFQRQLAARDIPIHYSVDELEEDLQTLRDMGRL